MTVDTLSETLDHLAEFEAPSPAVLSLYLDLRPESRATAAQFVEQSARAHEELSLPFDRIREALKHALASTTRTLAIFACAEPALFETVEAAGDIDGHRLYLDREPHLFPLARLADQFSPYAALLLNTNSARLYVFDAGAAQRQQTVRNKKGKRVRAGGWSQARYQRRVENLHLKHIKDVAAAVEKVIPEDHVQRILVAADDVAKPLLRDQLSPRANELLVEVSGIDINAADAEVYRVTLDAFREADVQSDADWVAHVMDAYRAHALATIGVAGVKAALERGQVDRLLVPAIPAVSATDRQGAGVESAGTKEQRGQLDEATVEELVTLARRTDAAITFIEEANLLEPLKGVGAVLRYRV